MDQQNSSQSNSQESVKESGEVLVVTSKLKNYIRTKSGMNTSASVVEALSEKVKQLCNEAIDHAKKEGRKTVMDRDFV